MMPSSDSNCWRTERHLQRRRGVFLRGSSLINATPIVQVSHFVTIKIGDSRKMPPSLKPMTLEKTDAGVVVLEENPEESPDP